MKENKVYFYSDKLKLCGILTTPDTHSTKCIILCHGITVDKDEDGIFTDLAHLLADASFNVFRFDFRGHGESEGVSTEMTITGEEQDLEAAYELLEGKGFTEFGLLGASFGGGATSFFAAKHPELKSLVLWNPVIDYESKINPRLPWQNKYWGDIARNNLKEHGFTEIGSRKFRIGQALWEEMETLTPWKSLLQTKIPILFVHGDKDNHVPYEDSVKYSKMNPYARLITIPGGEHGFHDDDRMSGLADKVTVDFFKETM